MGSSPCWPSLHANYPVNYTVMDMDTYTEVYFSLVYVRHCCGLKADRGWSERNKEKIVNGFQAKVWQERECSRSSWPLLRMYPGLWSKLTGFNPRWHPSPHDSWNICAVDNLHAWTLVVFSLSGTRVHDVMDCRSPFWDNRRDWERMRADGD